VPEQTDWLAIVAAHREIIKQGEEGFYTLSFSDRSRLWSPIVDLGETGIVGPWVFDSTQLTNDYFFSEMQETDATCFMGIGCVDVENGRSLRPLFFREVDTEILNNELRVVPESSKWSPTQVLFSLVDRVGAALGEDVEKLAERQLERAQRIADRDGTPFSEALINEVEGDFPQLQDMLRPSDTSFVIFTENRKGAPYNVHLMRDYDSLLKRLQEDPTDCGGLRVLERLGDVDRTSGENPLDFVPLNDSQRSAVKAILGHEHVTAVSGPPGCGKSQVVLSVLLNAWKLGTKTLFASTNNQAVDVVLERLHKFENDYPVAVRAGAKKNQRIVEAMDHAAALVTRAQQNKESDSNSERIKRLNSQREKAQRLLREGEFARINEQKNAALHAYGVSVESQQEYSVRHQELEEDLVGVHVSIGTPDQAKIVLMETQHFFEGIPSMQLKIDDDIRRRHSNRAKKTQAEVVRNQKVTAIGYEENGDMSCLETSIELDESSDWVRSTSLVLNNLTELDVEGPQWKTKFDDFASSEDAKSWAGEAKRLASGLRDIAPMVTQTFEREARVDELIVENESNLRNHGVGGRVNIPPEILRHWLTEHRASADQARSWKAKVPFGRSHRARQRLDLALNQMSDHLPASLWAQIRAADESPHTYFLPIAETLEIMQINQADQNEVKAEIKALEEFVNDQATVAAYLKIPELRLNDPMRVWTDHARTLEEQASEVKEAVEAWVQQERTESVAGKLRQLRSELEAKAAANPLWQSFLSRKGAQLRRSFAELNESPNFPALQVVREIFGSGLVDTFCEEWDVAHQSQIEVMALDLEASEMPETTDRISEWWRGRPALFSDLETPEKVPQETHEIFQRAAILEDRLTSWGDFLGVEGPEITERIEAETERANRELRRATEAIPEHFGPEIRSRIEEILERDEAWPLGEIDEMFAEVNPQMLKNEIQGIDAELEALSFGDAKQAWKKRVSNDAKGLSAIEALSRKFRKNLTVPPAMALDFRKMLEVLPVWVVTGQSTQSIPLEPELFDLLVIDEASQCTLTNLLPLLYRAKRVVVIGDKHQLPAIPSISSGGEDALFARYGLSEVDYRFGHNENDVYQVGVSCLLGRESDVHSLVEHYRSHPLIIGFANRHVYLQALELRRPIEERTETDYPPGVYLKNISGRAQPRKSSWVNAAEAEAVVDVVAELSSQPHIDSIGVVTPFRPQMELIQDLLEKSGLGDITVATAYGFQGAERDAMVFSPVVAAGMKEGTVRWASSKNLVNVAVTRAREILVVVCDTNFCKSQEGIIKDLVLHCEQVEKLRSSSPAELALFTRLMMEGINCRTHVVVANAEVDFVLKGRVRDIVVEVDGRQHAESVMADQARDAMLGANGYRVLRFTGRDVLETPGYVVSKIREALDFGYQGLR
jgi:very-short-patch-repair endonuclease